MEAGVIKPASQPLHNLPGLLVVLCSITVLPAIAGFYSFYFLLFDRYLSKKKITALCITGLIAGLLSGIFGIISLSVLIKGKWIFYTDYHVVLSMLAFTAVLALVHGIIALVMKGFISWYGDIKIKKELQQQYFETELALVKSQLSPHFLFNTINNIDVLIAKNAVQASAYLNKLSDIMRFMLYETKTENIPLQKELLYIEKYIDLQKIRIANPDFVYYTTEGDNNNWSIAPMLFAPFIENAFKHSVNKKDDHGIIIKINAANDALHFYCTNSYGENPLAGFEPGGLGNELIKKRLLLLYPGKHVLLIKKENNIFTVDLTIFAHGN
jgi:sensor histidine kinase YesM